MTAGGERRSGGRLALERQSSERRGERGEEMGGKDKDGERGGRREGGKEGGKGGRGRNVILKRGGDGDYYKQCGKRMVLLY